MDTIQTIKREWEADECDTITAIERLQAIGFSSKEAEQKVEDWDFGTDEWQEETQ